MSRHLLVYWKPEIAERSVGKELSRASGEQLKHVNGGDTLWIVTIAEGRLYLLGRLIVGEIVEGFEKARRYFKGDDVWDSRWHVAAEPGKVGVAALVELGDVVRQLRFQSSTADRLTVSRDGRVTPQQLQSHRRLMPESVAMLEAVLPGALDAADRLGSNRGAGFGDAEMNRRVELAAMRVVEGKYRQEGWLVVDVSAENRGYDLECKKGRSRLHVEVKGVRGDLPEFIITAGELRQAREDDHFVLAVVARACSKPKLQRFTGREFCDRFELKPTAFRARVRRK